MWLCEKCGREFKNANQNHTCGIKPANVDEYIVTQSGEIQSVLYKIRKIIREAAPKAIEKISWGMPTYWQGENLIHFAAQKNHVGIHPGALERLPAELLERLTSYKTSKGAIQLTYDKVDYELIKDITMWRVSNLESKKLGGE